MQQEPKNILEAIEVLRDDPLRYVDCECALSAGAFLVGYQMADAGAAAPVKGLLDRIPGPDQADGCTRAYLAYGRGPTGFQYALDELLQILRVSRPTPSLGPAAETPLIEQVRSALSSGRLGMYFGEPTIMWVSNYASGFLQGLESAHPAAWAEESASFQRFEAWLRTRYRSNGTWDELIRVFEGVSEHGLRRFVDLWDESRSSVE